MSSDPKVLDELREILAVSPANEWTVEKRRVGDDGCPVLIVDNILRHPEAVRDFALALRFLDPLPGDGWPGQQAAASLDSSQLRQTIFDNFVIDGLGLEIDPSVCLPVGPGERADGWSSFFLQTRFGKILGHSEHATESTTPHFDEFGFVAALIHLTEPGDCSGGTVFFRHRATGIQLVPPFAKALHQSLTEYVRSTNSFSRIRELDPELSLKTREGQLLTKRQHELLWSRLQASGRPTAEHADEIRAGQWEIVDQVDMKFNRLVVYPTWQLHGINWKPENSRHGEVTERLTMMEWFNFPFVPHRPDGRADLAV